MIRIESGSDKKIYPYLSVLTSLPKGSIICISSCLGKHTQLIKFQSASERYTEFALPINGDVLAECPPADKTSLGLLLGDVLVTGEQDSIDYFVERIVDDLADRLRELSSRKASDSVEDLCSLPSDEDKYRSAGVEGIIRRSALGYSLRLLVFKGNPRHYQVEYADMDSLTEFFSVLQKNPRISISSWTRDNHSGKYMSSVCCARPIYTKSQLPDTPIYRSEKPKSAL